MIVLAVWVCGACCLQFWFGAYVLLPFALCLVMLVLVAVGLVTDFGFLRVRCLLAVVYCLPLVCGLLAACCLILWSWIACLCVFVVALRFAVLCCWWVGVRLG